jgi:hypothetical protein
LIGAMCEHYGWAHDFYRSMGWRMFRRFLREMNASRERRAKAHRTSPDSWAGSEHDAFWPSSRKGR